MENKQWKNWLYFSRKERIALTILIILIGLFFLLPYLFPNHRNLPFLENTAAKSVHSEEHKVGYTTFFFDPNTLDSAGWRQLGIREKTVKTILHYREKGGRFRKPEDIAKIYGLHSDEVQRLLPYIKINAATISFTHKDLNNANKHAHYAFPLEINKAGVEYWAALPGVSPFLAQRIVKFRDAIHGFKNVAQVGKTYGLNAHLFAQIQPFLRMTLEKEPSLTTEENKIWTEKQTVANSAQNVSPIDQLNINTATEQEFSLQRKIPKNVAKAIIIYREQHGKYQDVTDIRKIVFINDEIFARVQPYLKVD